MLLKQPISLFLAMMLIAQPITILGSENANSSDVLLSVQAQVFSAVVPTQLPVWMSDSGVITTANDVNITNTSKGPIRVDNIELTNVKADWELVNFDSDFSSFKVGSKKLAMSFNGDKSLESGSIPLGLSNLTPIDGLGSMQLNYDAKIPAQSTGLVDEIPANVVFTLKWHEVGSADIEENNPNEYEFVPADTKVLTINFKGVTANDNTVVWMSSDEAVATVADYVSKGRARPIDGSKQCIVTAVGSGKATITGVLGDGTTNSFEVVVADKGVSSLIITKAPDKLAYIEGENFNATGMIVTVNYNNGTNVDISDYIIVDGNNLVIGQDLVVISYNGKTTNQPISVVEKNLTDIAITTPPTKTSYVEGSDFDATGMIVTAYYDNGMTEVIVPTLNGHTNLTIGQTSVNLSYAGKTISQAITVVAKTLTSITITTPPTKTLYEHWDNFDKSGMVVTANYDNSSIEVIASYEIPDGINMVGGKTSVTINYNGKTTTQVIRVIDLDIGTKHTEGNYEYSYGQELGENHKWYTDYHSPVKKGWGVRVIDKTQTDYVSPLTMIKGEPVTSMAYLFYKSPTTTLNLVDWDTSNIINMNSMFYSSNATNLDLSSFDTSNVTNMNWMFVRNNATSIVGLDDFDTSKVTNMSWMFNYSQATSLDLSSFDTSNVTSMSRMFAYSQATSIKGLNKFNTSNILNMGEMFAYSKTTSLDLSSFDTSKVTYMSDMFYQSKATSLDVSGFDTSNVTNMSGMFTGSPATSLDVSGFDTSNVTNMSSMFTGSKTTSLDLSGFDTSNVTNMRSMLGGSQETSLDLSSFNTSKVTDMSGMFSGSHATSLDLSGFDTSMVTNVSNMFSSSQVKALKARTQADADKYKTSSNFPTGITVTIKA